MGIFVISELPPRSAEKACHLTPAAVTIHVLPALLREALTCHISRVISYVALCHAGYPFLSISCCFPVSLPTPFKARIALYPISLSLSLSLFLWKMEEEKTGKKTPDDESTAGNLYAPPKMPESPAIPTEDLMDFDLDEEALEELRKLLEEDIVAPDSLSASEAAKIDGVGNAKKSGTTSPETEAGTPSSTMADADADTDMDDGISVSDLLESSDEGTNVIPSAENQPSGTEMDHILWPADQNRDSAAADDVSSKGDEEWRERVLGRVELNFVHMEDFEF